MAPARLAVLIFHLNQYKIEKKKMYYVAETLFIIAEDW